MHDHNILNYNEEYSFLNAECCRHLGSDLQKVYDNLQHTWASDLKKLLSDTNVKRNAGTTYDANKVMDAYDELLKLGYKQNATEHKGCPYKKTETALLNRLVKYKDNYLMWLKNQLRYAIEAFFN